MHAPSTDASVADRGDSRRIRVGFAAIVLAMLPAVLDQTILATALPTIATDLGRLAAYAWGSPEIIALLAALAISAIALVARTRRAEDPIVPLTLLRRPVVALSSTALFLVTATMFSITVFVPLFLQTTTGATPTQAGLLLIPMLVGITLSTTLAGRMIERTGRYKLFPLTGLAMISAAMVALAVVASTRPRSAPGSRSRCSGSGSGWSARY